MSTTTQELEAGNTPNIYESVSTSNWGPPDKRGAQCSQQYWSKLPSR